MTDERDAAGHSGWPLYNRFELAVRCWYEQIALWVHIKTIDSTLPERLVANGRNLLGLPRVASPEIIRLNAAPLRSRYFAGFRDTF